MQVRNPENYHSQIYSALIHLYNDSDLYHKQETKSSSYKDANGNFTMWNIVFQRGEIVKKDLKKDR